MKMRNINSHIIIIIVLYCIVLCGQTDLADPNSSCYLSLVDDLEWDDKLVTNCLDSSNPSPTRKKGAGDYCPNPDSQVYVSLICVYI